MDIDLCFQVIFILFNRMTQCQRNVKVLKCTKISPRTSKNIILESEADGGNIQFACFGGAETETRYLDMRNSQRWARSNFWTEVENFFNLILFGKFSDLTMSLEVLGLSRKIVKVYWEISREQWSSTLTGKLITIFNFCTKHSFSRKIANFFLREA